LTQEKYLIERSYRPLKTVLEIRYNKPLSGKIFVLQRLLAQKKSYLSISPQVMEQRIIINYGHPS
jgi:hypothetical protein